VPEKENLCLYGLPNETWEVTLPAEEVPPELPEPALGINFARDGMIEKDWLSLVAVHSDAWLLSVAFYFGARFGFDKDARFVFCFHCEGLIPFFFGFIHPFSVNMFPFHTSNCNMKLRCLWSQIYFHNLFHIFLEKYFS